jgi:hypothetical protein
MLSQTSKRLAASRANSPVEVSKPTSRGTTNTPFHWEQDWLGKNTQKNIGSFLSHGPP